MKIAIVHDYIKEFGGAERVLEVLSDIFPKADIYTTLYLQNFLVHTNLVYTKNGKEEYIPLSSSLFLFQPN